MVGQLPHMEIGDENKRKINPDIIVIKLHEKNTLLNQLSILKFNWYKRNY